MSDKPKSLGTESTVSFQLLAECVDSIGTNEFAKNISQFCAKISGSETVLLSAFFADDNPELLYSNHQDAADIVALDLYSKVAYILDPFFILFTQTAQDQVITLNEIAPDGFKKSEYYQQFYKAIRLEDECGLLLHMPGNQAIFISLGARQKGHKTDPENLRIVQPLIASLVRRHWTVLSPERPNGSGRLAAHLEKAFAAFGSSVLSPREGEIVRMIIRGYSSKAIAREYKNSPETIKVHRRRIYSKLGVASQGELLAVFLEALSKTPPTGTDDPFSYLQTSKH